LVRGRENWALLLSEYPFDGFREAPMNLFDIIVVVILCFCLIRGGFRGLIKELSAIVGVLAGYYGAYTYYPKVAAMLSGWIPDKAIGNILAFMIIFCAVFFLISILGIIIRYIFNTVFSGWLDRIGGIVFGFLKGGLIAAVLFIALTAFLPEGTPLLKQSRLSPYVARYAEVMAEVVSEDMKDGFKKKYKELKESWVRK
jgi:membrane protein required for colicin V production